MMRSQERRSSQDRAGLGSPSRSSPEPLTSMTPYDDEPTNLESQIGKHPLFALANGSALPEVSDGAKDQARKLLGEDYGNVIEPCISQAGPDLDETMDLFRSSQGTSTSVSVPVYQGFMNARGDKLAEPSAAAKAKTAKLFGEDADDLSPMQITVGGASDRPFEPFSTMEATHTNPQVPANNLSVLPRPEVLDQLGDDASLGNGRPKVQSGSLFSTASGGKIPPVSRQAQARAMAIFADDDFGSDRSVDHHGTEATSSTSVFTTPRLNASDKSLHIRKAGTTFVGSPRPTPGPSSRLGSTTNKPYKNPVLPGFATPLSSKTMRSQSTPQNRTTPKPTATPRIGLSNGLTPRRPGADTRPPFRTPFKNGVTPKSVLKSHKISSDSGVKTPSRPIHRDATLSTPVGITPVFKLSCECSCPSERFHMFDPDALEN